MLVTISRSRFLLALSLFTAPVAAQTTVQLDTDQPRLALAYVRASTPAARDSLWRLHASTRGYRRLHERESAMNRPFTDSAFRAFLDSDTLRARTDELSRTFDAWRRTDFASAEQRARRYLPAGTAIRATVFIMIKPRTNSFVFDVARDPAIFLYLDPARGAPNFANTAAHELHHIGINAACRETPDTGDAQSATRRWLSAFGEGWAMLAAAGSASTHPHAVSPDSERVVWDRDLAMAQDDMRRLERFFAGIQSGAIPSDSVNAKGFEFFAERPQGPWYTVGWLMASTIEREDGRDALLGLICDPMAVIRRYQAISKRTGGPRWSESFVSPD